MTRLVPRDERESTIDLVADRLASTILAFGILVIVAWRAFTDNAASWDLLGLLIVSGVVATGYRFSQRATSRRLMSVMAIAAAIGAVVAIGLAIFLKDR